MAATLSFVRLHDVPFAVRSGGHCVAGTASSPGVGLDVTPEVLPRLLALALMMPLLAVYADLFGMLGGAIVGVGLFDLSPAQYWQQSLRFIGLKDFAGGLLKAVVFGVLVGAAGCLRGIRSGRDAAAVGASTTAAVVSGIVAVIVADCLLNVVYHALGV